jgi:hypothetical protein
MTLDFKLYYAHTTHVSSNGQSGSKKKSWVERRACFVCGEVGHVPKKCPKKAVEGSSGQKRAPPVVLFSQGESSSSSPADLLFDSGATHHVLCSDRHFHDVGTSSVSTIQLGGGEVHYVMGAGKF